MTTVKPSEVHRFIVDCLLKVKNTPREHCIAVADSLIEADEIGFLSHGLNRLDMYIQDLELGISDGTSVPKILNETKSTAWVDGCNALGAVVANYCIDIAIEKAKLTGISCVSVKNSNHYGIGTVYLNKALKEGLLSFTCSNTSPYMCPTRSKGKALGTNPITFSAPGVCDDSFILDMATTAISNGKVELSLKKGIPLPPHTALDEYGNETTDPAKALKSRSLMPLGGSEETGGYKGYGIALMVEALSGILAGGPFGPNIPERGQGIKNLSHCFIVIDPNVFCSGFEERMTQMNELIRNLPPADEKVPVIVPGDLFRMSKVELKNAGGITYPQNIIEFCDKIAEKYCVTKLQPLTKF